MLAITGLVVRIHVQDAVIVDPVPAQVETLENNAGTWKRPAKLFDKIVPRACFENSAPSRFRDLVGSIGYEPLVKGNFLQSPTTFISFIIREAKIKCDARQVPLTGRLKPEGVHCLQISPPVWVLIASG